MTEPRAHYALPPPSGDPPPSRADQLDLWVLDCERCEGAGTIAVAADEGDPMSRAPCPVCKGAGAIAFRSIEPRGFDWRE